MTNNDNGGPWTLEEGLDRLLSGEDADFEDLATEDCILPKSTISFLVLKEQEDGREGLSVMLQFDSDEIEGDAFDHTYYPDEDETMKELAIRVAKGLGVKLDEKIWEDASMRFC